MGAIESYFELTITWPRNKILYLNLLIDAIFVKENSDFLVFTINKTSLQFYKYKLNPNLYLRKSLQKICALTKLS